MKQSEKKIHKLPVGHAAAAAVDTFIDGTIISAGFLTGQRLGLMLIIALALELFFLTLSVGTEFHKLKSKQWRGLAMLFAGFASILALRLFTQEAP